MFEHRSFNFPSVMNPDKWGFVYLGNESDYFSQEAEMGCECVASGAGYFETLGDGTTQHTPTTLCRTHHFTDYCVSLAKFLMENFGKYRIRKYVLNMDAPALDVALAYSRIKYDAEGKRAYFTVDAGVVKVSTAESRKHDKRWMEVPTWAKGTGESGMELCWYHRQEGRLRYHTIMEVYTWMERFKDACSGQGVWAGYFEKYTEQFNAIPGDHRSAFRALQYAIEASEHAANVENCIDVCMLNSALAVEHAA